MKITESVLRKIIKEEIGKIRVDSDIVDADSLILAQLREKTKLGWKYSGQMLGRYEQLFYVKIDDETQIKLKIIDDTRSNLPDGRSYSVKLFLYYPKIDKEDVLVDKKVSDTTELLSFILDINKQYQEGMKARFGSFE